MDSLAKVVLALATTPKECTCFMPVNHHRALMQDVVDEICHAGYEINAVSSDEMIDALQVALTDESKSDSLVPFLAYANDIATKLTRLGICKGAIVGVYLPYTKDFAVSVLAVWKIGGIFMPTDAAYLSKRLKYMVENSKASALISGRSLQDMIENFYINFCDMNIFHMQLYRQDSQQ